MQISKNTVVTFHYQLNEPDQPVFEDSREANQPVVYLHGHDGILKGLEKALEGKNQGDHVAVTLAPEDAYGERNKNAIQRVSINHVYNPSRKKLKFRPGQIVYLNTKEGPQPVIVLKAGLKSLDVDTNHPLAGRTLHFEVDVVSVREASEEEIAHGHVHGEGGVHH